MLPNLDANEAIPSPVERNKVGYSSDVYKNKILIVAAAKNFPSMAKTMLAAFSENLYT